MGRERKAAEKAVTSTSAPSFSPHGSSGSAISPRAQTMGRERKAAEEAVPSASDQVFSPHGPAASARPLHLEDRATGALGCAQPAAAFISQPAGRDWVYFSQERSFQFPSASFARSRLRHQSRSRLHAVQGLRQRCPIARSTIFFNIQVIREVAPPPPPR